MPKLKQKYINMEQILIDEIKKEITLLEKWINDSLTGGWSTHLVQPMRTRVTELKSRIYDVTNK